ncbi:MBL fold metallo-hydrolase [Bacillus sp. P14.5]|uniref:MBL fold metallo-hydrolase n=1 Tax=Bacillus sp. P14.5 TaxID=1983400 RepID=UPI000DE9FA98|nr:MBL fold metallo-hydrolase [Bacillus sp. P14.5]
MKKLIAILSTLIILLSLLPVNSAAASTYSKAEKLVTEAEQWAGALKWEISYEYRKKKFPENPVTYPDMNLYNNTKEPMLAAEKLLPSLSSSKRNELRKRIDQNIKVHYLRAQAYIDAITSGKKILNKTNSYNKSFAHSPISDQTVQAYHNLSSEIRKQAVLLYRVYGQSTRDAILSKYKAPGETAKHNTIYAISAKMAFDQLIELDNNNQPIENQIDLVISLIERVQDDNAKALLESQLNKFLLAQIGDLHVDFINAGQGDSILVETPNGMTMLVDGGNTTSGDDVVSHLQANDVTKIDVMVATHPDADHVGGLMAVLNKFPVSEVIVNGKTDSSDTYREFLSLVQQKSIPVSTAEEGDFIELDPMVSIEVLNSGSNSSDNDDASIVMMISHGDVEYLLTGDSGIETEERLIQDYYLEADVLKIGSHGLNTSTSQAFIEAVNPTFGILSYGEGNSEGAPHNDVFDRLMDYGVDMISTPNGTIEMYDDGDYIYINQQPENAATES